MNETQRELPQTSMRNRLERVKEKQENMLLHSQVSTRLGAGSSRACEHVSQAPMIVSQAGDLPSQASPTRSDRAQLLFMTPEVLLKNELRQLLLWPLPHLKLHLPRPPCPDRLSHTEGQERIKMAL